MSEVGDAMQKYRREEDMTQRYLAMLLDVSAAYVNDLEHDRRRIEDDTIRAIRTPQLRRVLMAARRSEYIALAKSMTP